MYPLPAPSVVRRATRLGVVLAILGPLSLSASAQDLSGDKGRFTMSPVDNGFVRLDTQTGAISHCKRTDGRWTCEAMTDGGEDQRQEVERLRKENTELRAEIKRLDDMLGLGDNARPGLPGNGSAQGFRIPTEKEVDQALDYFERMLKKFQDRLKRLEEKPSEAPPAKPEEKPAERKTAF